MVPTQKTIVESTRPKARKDILPKTSHPSTNNPAVRNQTNNTVNSKPLQESGGNYEAKLVEMINTSIVDTSPSVKWEDVGKKFMLSIINLFPSEVLLS